MSRSLFGTDGIRGKANIFPMTGEVAFTLGRAVTHFFQTKKKDGRPVIVIGKDTRLSCYMLEQAFSSGVCAQGGRAILTGPLPTPGVAFATKSMRASAGVMISASHNNFSDNGIKIFDAQGHKLPDQVELELEKMVLNANLIPVKTDGELGNAKRLDEVIGRYIVHVKSTINESFSLEGMRLVVDCANGAAYKTAPLIFEELGAEVFTVGTSPNGTNINEYVGSTYPEQCAKKVTKYRADLGICLDGDADRLVMVDPNGNVIHGDRLIGVMAKFLKKTGQLDSNNQVVGTVLTNIGLEKYLANEGMNMVRTQVGDRYIFEYMRQNNAWFGGEPSGHMIFARHATTGDGILAALKVIECMKYFNKNLRELTQEVTLMPQIQKNVEVKSKPDFKTIPPIAQTLADVEKELGNQGRVLLRYSGTEPKARVMVEGQDAARLDLLCTKLVNVVSKELGP